MTIIAKRSVQLNGHIYSRGEAAEWNGPIDSRIAELFTAKDGSPLSAGSEAERNSAINSDGDNRILERVDKLVAKLGRKGIEQKLDELKVSFSSKANTEALAKLLLQQQGEIDA